MSATVMVAILSLAPLRYLNFCVAPGAIIFDDAFQNKALPMYMGWNMWIHMFFIVLYTPNIGFV
jgi:hypothetical protein